MATSVAHFSHVLLLVASAHALIDESPLQLTELAEAAARQSADRGARYCASQFYEHLAVVWAKCGRFDQAVVALRRITDYGSRIRAKEETIAQAAAARNLELAEAIARQESDSFDRTALLCDVARLTSSTERAGYAARLLDECVAANSELDDPSLRDAGLSEIAMTSIEIEDWVRAERVAELASTDEYVDVICRLVRIRNDYEANSALLERALLRLRTSQGRLPDGMLAGLSECACHICQYVHADNMLRTIGDRSVLDAQLSRNALIRARDGDLAGAMEWARSLNRGDTRVRTFYQLASTAHLLRRDAAVEECLMLARKSEGDVNGMDTADLVAERIVALGACGAFDEALTLLAEAAGAQRVMASVGLMRDAVRAGRVSDCERILASAPAEIKGQLLALAAVESVKRNDCRNAERWAVQIDMTVGDDRARALANVATAIAERGDPLRARLLWADKGGHGGAELSDDVHASVALAWAAKTDFGAAIECTRKIRNDGRLMSTYFLIGRALGTDVGAVTEKLAMLAVEDTTERAWLLLGASDARCERERKM